MFGSWLLFRGYGSTKSKRPGDAAMAGTASLVLLDEAHLALHLRNLLPALAECTPEHRPFSELPAPGRTSLPLTATGNAGEGFRFDLDVDDEAYLCIDKASSTYEY